MTTNDERRTFVPRRKMDRLLVLLFFVDFTISIVLCVLVGHLINVIDTMVENQRVLEEIACVNNAILSNNQSDVCQQYLPDIKE